MLQSKSENQVRVTWCVRVEGMSDRRQLRHPLHCAQTVRRVGGWGTQVAQSL